MDANLTLKKPADLSFEDAASIPLGYATASSCVFSDLGIPVPADSSALPIEAQTDAPPVLVWGASSSVGQYALQILKICGYRVIAVCGARNFDYVKALGADWAFDHSDARVVDQIKHAANDQVRLVVEYVERVMSLTMGASVADEHACSQHHVQARLAGQVGRRLRKSRRGVEHHQFPPGRLDPWRQEGHCPPRLLGRRPEPQVGHSLLGPRHLVLTCAGWSCSDADFGRATHRFLQRVLDAGLLKPNKIEVMPNGLLGIDDGFQRYRDGKVSGGFCASL